MWKIYRHRKGAHYLHLATALHSETKEPLEVYRTLYDNELSRTWARPRTMFFDSDPGGNERFTLVGAVRRPASTELREILLFGYDTWAEGQSEEDFVAGYDRAPDSLRGEWFLLEDADGISCAKMKVIRFEPQVVGLASIATKPDQRGRGYGTLMTRSVMEILTLENPDTRFLLFSEVGARMYERIGFRVLPNHLQLFLPSLAMASGEGELTEHEESFLKRYF